MLGPNHRVTFKSMSDLALFLSQRKYEDAEKLRQLRLTRREHAALSNDYFFKLALELDVYLGRYQYAKQMYEHAPEGRKAVL
jgi:hypothetical protein